MSSDRTVTAAPHFAAYEVRVFSRNAPASLVRSPDGESCPELLHHRTAVLDGKIVALDQGDSRPGCRGRSSAPALR